MTKSYSRGHEIYYDGIIWRYTDTKGIFDDSRSCNRCGQYPTKDGHDACLGEIEGAVACCCGHGVAKKYIQ